MQIKQISIFLIFILFIIFIIPLQVKATENTESTLSEYELLKENLSNEIGIDNANNLFQSIEEKIIYLRETNATIETMYNAIDEISNSYGVVFSEEQKNMIIKNFEENITRDILSNFWDWLKSLYNKSEVSVKQNVESDKLVESNGEYVTVYIPTVEKVDTIMDRIIIFFKELLQIETEKNDIIID